MFARSARQILAVTLLLLATACLSLALVEAPAASAQVFCAGEHANFGTACDLGEPNEQGTTVLDTLTLPDQVRAYRFRVGPEPSAAHIYLGDQWFNLDLALWRTPSGRGERPDGCASSLGCLAESRSQAPLSVQFIKPESIVVPQLDANSEYTIFVFPGERAAMDPYHPFETFTLRVALSAPLCATGRDAGGLYQLGVSVEPPQPGPRSLLTFTALLSPPYGDLFDFAWEVDGRPMPGETIATMQLPAPSLAPVGGQHRLRVTAQGVRAYPDPDQPEMPPALSAECSFNIS